ncbi:unnamed protein product, partial [Protopolystoma xenopodis]
TSPPSIFCSNPASGIVISGTTSSFSAVTTLPFATSTVMSSTTCATPSSGGVHESSTIASASAAAFGGGLQVGLNHLVSGSRRRKPNKLSLVQLKLPAEAGLPDCGEAEGEGEGDTYGADVQNDVAAGPKVSAWTGSSITLRINELGCWLAAFLLHSSLSFLFILSLLHCRLSML